MTRELAVLVMALAAVIVLGMIAWGWRRRIRRDEALVPPRGELSGEGDPRASFEVLHVATTRVDEPLERLAVKGLGYRSMATLSVSGGGITLDLTGQERIPIAADRISGVDQATVTIDRVVERDGLVRLTWRLNESDEIDTYFRPRDASARALAESIRDVIPSGDTA